MSFNDFKGIWFVKDAESGEIVGHRIAIGGLPLAVRVICIDDQDGHRYYSPRYVADPEHIEVKDAAGASFALTVETGDPNVVRCAPLRDHQGPGSWTADDNSGDDGN
jgi:hypothetical protein